MSHLSGSIIKARICAARRGEKEGQKARAEGDLQPLQSASRHTFTAGRCVARVPSPSPDKLTDKARTYLGGVRFLSELKFQSPQSAVG